ncbi:MAG TPA: hypothetical protein VF557_06210 [Jatrophihabitans sp.]|uniref:hypothetical protein n=1 Tax=Jatrophihabitans sp. TaxID=1932789 RepID=UPI002F10BA1E
MQKVALAVEGPTDRAAAERILVSRKLLSDADKTFVTRGKSGLNKKIEAYNQAAKRGPWLVMRDLDHDGSGCPVLLRESLLHPSVQVPGMCFRIAVRSLEAWLLADTASMSDFFKVSEATVPVSPEDLDDPKSALVNVCRKSRSADIRQAMVPPSGTQWQVGPEYTARVIEYCSRVWNPDAAKGSAPSLARALGQIDRLIAHGSWG